MVGRYSLVVAPPARSAAISAPDGSMLGTRGDATFVLTGREGCAVKGFRSTGMTAIVAALLIGCTPAASPAPSSPSPAPSTDLSAGPPGLVTGQFVFDGGGEFQESVEVEGGLKERVRERTGRSEMSDERLTGTVKVTDNADRFTAGQTFLGDVLWGTIAIENDQGTWAGTSTGTTDLSADGAGVTYFELVGAGGYKGLSAVISNGRRGRRPILSGTGTASSSLARYRPIVNGDSRAPRQVGSRRLRTATRPGW